MSERTNFRVIQTTINNRPRYICVDPNNYGIVLADGNGYGYTSKESAFRAGSYLLNDYNDEYDERKIKAWFLYHQEIVQQFYEESYEIISGQWDESDRVDIHLFRSILHRNNIYEKHLPCRSEFMFKYFMSNTIKKYVKRFRPDYFTAKCKNLKQPSFGPYHFIHDDTVEIVKEKPKRKRKYFRR